MEYRLAKSGLEIFDAARAYGLAQLLQTIAEDNTSPTISDEGGVYTVYSEASPVPSELKRSDLWRAMFAENNWQRVFLTYKNGWSKQRDQVKSNLEKHLEEILRRAETERLMVGFQGDRALPGSLDPGGFKGLKGLTAGSYSEDQTTVDELNWALACLGAVVAQRYKIQKATGNKWEYYVTLPVPEKVRFSDFHRIRHLVYEKGLSYTGVRNGAAHFSLLLADAVRENAEGNPFFPARFSTVVYFSLFQSGQQFKPSVGGTVSLSRLIEVALARPQVALELFKTWDYLFRRGSAQGNEDLAESITELIMTPSLETYYRHARIFNRYIVDQGVKGENLYAEKALEEAMKYVQ